MVQNPLNLSDPFSLTNKFPMVSKILVIGDADKMAPVVKESFEAGHITYALVSKSDFVKHPRKSWKLWFGDAHIAVVKKRNLHLKLHALSFFLV